MDEAQPIDHSQMFKILTFLFSSEITGPARPQVLHLKAFKVNFQGEVIIIIKPPERCVFWRAEPRHTSLHHKIQVKILRYLKVGGSHRGGDVTKLSIVILNTWTRYSPAINLTSWSCRMTLNFISYLICNVFQNLYQKSPNIKYKNCIVMKKSNSTELTIKLYNSVPGDIWYLKSIRYFWKQIKWTVKWMKLSK